VKTLKKVHKPSSLIKSVTFSRKTKAVMVRAELTSTHLAATHTSPRLRSLCH